MHGITALARHRLAERECVDTEGDIVDAAAEEGLISR
jgi:hypothetical protein